MAKLKKSKKGAARITPKKKVVTKRLTKEATMDQLEQENQALTERVEELERENEKLKARIEELEAIQANPTQAREEEPKWERGVLPGNKYIKTDLNTGNFEEITKQEWDQLR